MTNLPDYYFILDVPVTSSHDEIREGKRLFTQFYACQENSKNFIKLAYKKQALINHPDRLPTSATREEREEATRKFQLVADAYYILGDRSRRENYDKSRSKQKDSTFAAFASAMPNASTAQANHIFGDIFEELLKPEGKFNK